MKNWRKNNHRKLGTLMEILSLIFKKKKKKLEGRQIQGSIL